MNEFHMSSIMLIIILVFALGIPFVFIMWNNEKKHKRLCKQLNNFKERINNTEDFDQLKIIFEELGELIKQESYTKYLMHYVCLQFYILGKMKTKLLE